MKKVLIFGFGQMGKKLVDEIIMYPDCIKVNAIIDNYVNESEYREIPIIKPEQIKNYLYDEILICTVYFKQIMEELSQKYGIQEKKMTFAEPVMPILETRIRKRYEKEIIQNEQPQDEKQEVIQYIKNNPVRMYCYDFYDEYLIKKTNVYFDETNGLFYAIYKGKRMYLARNFNTEQKARAYYNAVIMEQDSRSPHCYYNNKNFISLSGIGVDIGAAEGIFALEIIEQIDQIYIIEAESAWIEALKYTFQPYKSKVTIIKTFISDKDTEDTTRLDTLFKDKKIDFMKMDIEGEEYCALKGAQELIGKNNIKLVVCVYHNKDDNERISEWLKKRHYICSNSEGLVVCQGEWELKNMDIDFRKALLFAMKKRHYEKVSNLYTQL